MLLCKCYYYVFLVPTTFPEESQISESILNKSRFHVGAFQNGSGEIGNPHLLDCGACWKLSVNVFHLFKHVIRCIDYTDVLVTSPPSPQKAWCFCFFLRVLSYWWSMMIWPIVILSQWFIWLATKCVKTTSESEEPLASMTQSTIPSFKVRLWTRTILWTMCSMYKNIFKYTFFWLQCLLCFLFQWV